MKTIALPTFKHYPSGDFKSECNSIDDDLQILALKLKDILKRAKKLANRAEKAYVRGNKLYTEDATGIKPKFKQLPKMMESLDGIRYIDAAVANAIAGLELDILRIPRVKEKLGEDFEIVEVKKFKV